MSPRRPRWKDLLVPFAGHGYEINRRILRASDADLRTLAKACKRPTQTNCGWAAFMIAPLVLDLAKGELGHRRLARKIARRKEAKRP